MLTDVWATTLCIGQSPTLVHCLHRTHAFLQTSHCWLRMWVILPPKKLLMFSPAGACGGQTPLSITGPVGNTGKQEQLLVDQTHHTTMGTCSLHCSSGCLYIPTFLTHPDQPHRQPLSHPPSENSRPPHPSSHIMAKPHPLSRMAQFGHQPIQSHPSTVFSCHETPGTKHKV